MKQLLMITFIAFILTSGFYHLINYRGNKVDSKKENVSIFFSFEEVFRPHKVMEIISTAIEDEKGIVSYRGKIIEIAKQKGADGVVFSNGGDNEKSSSPKGIEQLKASLIKYQ